MTHVIAEPCIGVKSGECVDVCPVDCIHPKTDEARFGSATQLYIDGEVCIDCGACVTVCPVTAIFPEAEVPAQWKPYSAINNAYYRGGALPAPPPPTKAPAAASGAPASPAPAVASAPSGPAKKVELVQVAPPSPPEEGGRDAAAREREMQAKMPRLLDKGRLFG